MSFFFVDLLFEVILFNRDLGEFEIVGLVLGSIMF